MDLRKVSNEEKLKLCRTYYRAGFFFLPFLWLVNFIWFFREAFTKPAYEQQKQIKTYIIRSLIGASIWIVLLITWITIFQLKRAEWGVPAEKISFIIPKGIP